MVTIYQSVGSLSGRNEMQIQPTKFSASCFLIPLLDLSVAWNCPTNKEFHYTERSESRIKQHPHTQIHTVMCVLRVSQEFKKNPAHSRICCSIYFLKSLWAWHHLSLFHQSQRLFSKGGCLTFNQSLFLTLLKNLLSGIFKNGWSFGPQ